MKHSFEIEIRQTEGKEPALHGVILQEGRAAKERRELFTLGSITWPAQGIAVLPAHHAPEESRAHPVRAANGEIRISARATPALREAVEKGSRFMSLEFHMLEQRNTAGGVREITRALMTAAALTPTPEYTQSSAEIRNLQDKEKYLRWL